MKQVFAAILLLLLGSGPILASPDATDVRVGVHPGKTRFVIDLTEKVDFRLFSLPDPYRVVIDLSQVDWKISGGGARRGEGLIGVYRYGLFKPGTTRVVLDVNGPVTVDKAFLLPPKDGKRYRLVIDLKRATEAEFMVAVEKGRKAARERAEGRARQTARDEPAPQRPVRTNLPGENAKRVVVIDAGHGGVDPGAHGVNGVWEKRLTLDVAQELRKILEAKGNYKVVMTRDRDIFLPLRDRVDVARRANANLFISIHADSIANRRVRGATVYTLSERASDAEAAALARKENKADLIAGVDLDRESDEVASILIDLAQRETMNYSAQLANVMVPVLGDAVTLRKNSHRFAGFVVLKAPDVPSVLVEMGYLSNRQDAKILTSKSGQRNIARALARAVDRYFAMHST